jgi:hypothetical protein
MYTYQVELWESINGYAESCGGDTTSATANRPSRMSAVVAVEAVIEKIRFAPPNNQMQRTRNTAGR